MKNRNTKLILGVSIIIALTMLGVIVFAIKIIENTNKNISTLKSNLEDKIREKDNATSFAEKVTEIELVLSSINNHFVDSNKIDTFVSYLEEIGPMIGTEIVVKNVEVPTKSKNTISFTVSIDGSFDNVAKTISMLENIPYQITPNRVFLSKNIEQKSEENLMTGDPTWQADVSFNLLSLE